MILVGEILRKPRFIDRDLLPPDHPIYERLLSVIMFPRSRPSEVEEERKEEKETEPFKARSVKPGG